ncbi:MAG: Rrf2 family transcriptional regulator [Clostridium sp.]|jgi:Rrf2 family protein|uniref:RrF2 family transcriptional regulator n=1 Tax=Clostridium sp. TaxID=1506 RepID=UPI0025BF724A|nr:Rrf2 family transcriptional regulator [Clostridium sp.]MCH3962867.1 Rrf2 family transcriptional regulator [Clostridium sp.]MCI1715718.1 Rrf2 family transcriptional regulator [Clostridium sp.]MCI1800077.1 Rrf2 family transcriptional regulator [Clostridium sp.]MCI1813991.1 Rrf2 family transcriptional regulator [Clostridium sp.]MCI1870889.1 Rrf2 family transcriptional regulator [Clostridium sp.]
MRITQEADYGFRVILYLSKLGYGEKIEAKSISKDQGIPLRFLLKLLRKLTLCGIIKSYRGVNGGYSLNRIPENITLKDVIEAIDGPIYINRCLDNPKNCNMEHGSYCVVNQALSRVQNNLLDELGQINFKDMLKKEI